MSLIAFLLFRVSDTNNENYSLVVKDQAVLSSIILYFFGLGRHKFTKKVNPGVFFSFFRLSKIEKRRVSPILDSLKFHSKGPVQLQTGTNHSFLGFEFKLGWTCPKDELIIKHMLSSSSLLKIKRYLPEMVGEKREE